MLVYDSHLPWAAVAALTHMSAVDLVYFLGGADDRKVLEYAAWMPKARSWASFRHHCHKAVLGSRRRRRRSIKGFLLL